MKKIQLPSYLRKPSWLPQGRFKHATIRARESARRTGILSLAILMTIEYLLVPLAYAESLPTNDTKPKAQGSNTLITDTEPADESYTQMLKSRTVKLALDDSFTQLSAFQNETAVVKRLSKEDFRPNEDVTVTIENGAKKAYHTELLTPTGTEVAVEAESIEVGSTKVLTLIQPRKFRPGVYTLRVTDDYGGVSEQDFSWGVLAINADKSVYSPNEVANFSMAVLNELGEMVCDAQVELTVTNPLGVTTSLSTDNGKIQVNPTCTSYDFTLTPDYEASFRLGVVGSYGLELHSQTKNGSYTITDVIEVRNSISFDVKRVSATRIYPPHTYPVTMEIVANQDFEGTIAETVPAEFRIGPPGEKVLTEKEEVDEMLLEARADDASESAKPTTDEASTEDVATESVIAPEVFDTPFLGGGEQGVLAATDTNAISYDTVNDLTENRSVLPPAGVSIPQFGMPFSGPYPVSQEFGDHLVQTAKGSFYEELGLYGHDGIDFALPQGTPVNAVADAEVLHAGPGDYGITVVLQHSWGRSYYGHLSSVAVAKGDKVSAGTILGASGSTGFSTGPHLHFAIKPDENDNDNGYFGKVDPGYYLGLKQKSGVVLGASTSLDRELGMQPTTDVKILTWKVKLKKGDKITIGYNYLAPKISPQFYTLGPATFTKPDGEKVFQENRKWQIAADVIDLKMKKGSFTKSTCTASCSQSITGLGFQPKAIIFEWTLQTTDNAFSSDLYFGTGFATNDSSAIQNRALSFWDEDNQGTSDTGRRQSATAAIMMESANGSLVAQGAVSAFGTDGFTINWTTNNTSQYVIRYTALGGADITRAKAGTINVPSTVSGSTSYTDPGFQPDFLNIIGGEGTTTTSQPGVQFSVGYASGPSNQGAFAMRSDDGALSGDTDKYQNTGYILTTMDISAGGVEAEGALTSFDATGFTINYIDGPEFTTDFYYLAIKGGKYTVGNFTQPTGSTSSQEITTGFRPSGVGFASYGGASSGSSTADGQLMIGGASVYTSYASNNLTTTKTQGVMWGGADDGPTVMNTNVATYSDHAIVFGDPQAASPSTIASAKLDDISDDSFTLDWDVVDGTARQIIYWAAGSSTASQEDFRWYKNTNALQPTEALEDQNTATIVAKQKANVRLRANFSVGGNGLTASQQQFKLQYASAKAESGVSATNDWCNDTTGISCFYSADGSTTSTSGWCNDTTGITCDTSWSTRRTITINNSASSENLTNFPILVKLNSSRIDYDKTQNNGEDIRFVDPSDPTTVLSHEIETWNESGTSYVWVKVPQIDSGSTTDSIYMYYGNAAATDGQNVSDVWSNNFNAVYHMDESSGTTLTDSTSNANSATKKSAAEPNPTTVAPIGNGQDFDGTDDYARANDSASLDLSSAGTISSWVNRDATASAGLIGKSETTTTRSQNYALILSGNNPFLVLGNGITSQDLYFGSDVTDNDTDYFLSGTWDSSNVRSYFNGAAGGSAAQTVTPLTNNDQLKIGEFGLASNRLNGVLDEVRIASVARSADWVEAEYLTGTDAMNSFSSEVSQSQTNYGWQYRRKITFNNSASSTNLTNFPVLIKLDSTRIDYTKTQNNGEDIRFVDPTDRTTVLPHEVESWDEGGNSYVWVSVPQIDSGSTTDYIYMYYGNSTASSGENASGVWDTGGYEGVWHLAEDPSASSPQMTDSTSNGYNGTSVGSMTTSDQVSGRVNGSLEFDGSNDYINTGRITEVESVTKASVSMWAKRATSGSSVAATKENGTTALGVQVYTDGRIYFLSTSASSYGYLSNSDTEWHHLTLVFDGSLSGNENKLKGFVDGVQQTLTFSGTVPTSTTSDTSNFLIGRIAESGSNYSTGRADEVRIAATDRSADYVKADYLTQTDQFNTYGQEQAYTVGGTSTVGWTDVGTTATWSFKDNAGVTDGVTITTALLSNSSSGSQQSYAESNPTALNPTAMASGAIREFDFSLNGTNASSRRTYYFRIVGKDGTPLTTYTRYPSITVGVPNEKYMRGGKWFNYKREREFDF